MTNIYIGSESIPYFDLTITNPLQAADTATFTADRHIEDMSIIHILGEHQPFGGFVLKRNETDEGYSYDCMDFTRLLFGKTFKSYYNKTSSQILTELLEERGMRTSGINKTSKKHAKLIFKAKKAIDICHQLANLETNMEFYVNSDGVAVLRQIPETAEGYVFADPSVFDYSLTYDPTNLVTGVVVYGENDKLLYSYYNKELIAKYFHMTDIIMDSSLKTQSDAKAKANELFKEKGKIEFSGSLTIPILKDMKAGLWLVFYPPEWSKNGAKSYYVNQVRTRISADTMEQQIDLLSGKPSPPSEWIYEDPETHEKTKVSASDDAVTAKAKSLGNPRAIRRWIDANIKYVFYYNKKYTPAQVFSIRKGNCMDQSDLFVLMCKAIGYNAKRRCGVYCNGYRHCDALVYLDGRWIQVDVTCHSRNKLV